MELALWFAPHGVHPTLGELSINDTSLFMRLQVGEVVHAFTGDMNEAEGNYLLAQLGPCDPGHWCSSRSKPNCCLWVLMNLGPWVA